VKLLAFSDLHRDEERALALVERSAEADVVVGAGDFASFRRGLAKTLDPLSAITTPTVLVCGNNERLPALREAASAWPAATVLHGEATEIDGVTFFGLGAAVPRTPFPWSYDITEAEADELLERCPSDAVLVVHSPPKGYLDVAFGRHLGSEAVLAAIQAKQPRVALCGHIHQCWGQSAAIDGTSVFNLGPDGTWVEV